jgi:hypothetical protein
MAVLSPLELKYEEAVHLAGLLRNITRWDASAVIRIQTRGKVAGVWAKTPMDCMVFIAIPLANEPAMAVDCVVFASRMRDILGDLSSLTESNRLHSYALPDDLGKPLEYADMPPESKWIQGEKLTCGNLNDAIEKVIAEYHEQMAMFPKADDKMRDFVANQVWQGKTVSGFPLRGIHIARQLGFLSHENALANFQNVDGWKRMSTPGGQIYFDDRPKKTKLSVVR